MRNSYKKNKNYKQEELNKHIDKFRNAKDKKDKEQQQNAINSIYELTNKYVYKVLWEYCPLLMLNPDYREELYQEAWVVLTKYIERYDYHKGSITTFMKPHIKHAISVCNSYIFKNTSAYYCNAIAKIQKAFTLCCQKNIEPTLSEICKQACLSKITVKRSLDILAQKNMASYEALLENGYDTPSRTQTPEEYVLKKEQRANIHNVLIENLDEKEYQASIYYVTPNNPKRDHESFRQVALKMNTYGLRVQNFISSATKKLEKINEMQELLYL